SRDFFWLKLDAPGQAEPGPVEGARAEESGEPVDFAALSRPAPVDAGAVAAAAAASAASAAAPAGTAGSANADTPETAHNAYHEEGSAA
ncbi:trehalose synthase, partial [Actinotignum timonense]|nr:trehalose synthase [Actinotignum timonense]